MLKKIQCDEFKTFDGAIRPPIEFHKGLNAVIGNEFGSRRKSIKTSCHIRFVSSLSLRASPITFIGPLMIIALYSAAIRITSHWKTAK